jgi:di/tricarboxylate transporter
MSLSIFLLLITVLVPLMLVGLNKLRMDIAALLIACLLGIYQLTGLQMVGNANTPNDAIKSVSGFSQPVIITLISLFIITKTLENSGIPRWIAQKIVNFGKDSTGKSIGLFSFTSAFLSLFMNNLAASALLLPSAMEASRLTKIKPSKLLIPIAYGSLLGGAATYFTTANIILNDLLKISSPPQRGLNFLDFTPTGGLIAIAGILFIWIAGKKLLPDRESTFQQAQARLTGSELEDFFQLGDRLWQAQLIPGSLLDHKTIREAGFGQKWGVAIAAIQNGNAEFNLPYPDLMLTQNKKLFIVGREEKIDEIRKLGVDFQLVQSGLHLTERGIRVVEIVLTPHSTIVDQTLKALNFRQKFGVSIVGIRHLKQSKRTDVGDINITYGDSLLVIGDEEHINRLKQMNDFIIIEPNPADQPVQRKLAIVSTLAISISIVASITGVPVYIATLIGALIVLLLKAINIEEAYKSIHWQAIFLIAGMYSVSLAMVETGLAGQTAKLLIQTLEPLGGLGIASGAFLLSAFLTQIMGGQITALVSGPITIGAAISLGINPQAIAVATAIGCSVSFLTPMAHPVNVMMIGPGNYKFGDFARVGWILTILSFGMLLVGMKLFWNL